jgi:hypothetical protein
MAEHLRGINLEDVRRAAAEGRMSLSELRHIEQSIGRSGPFLRLDLEQALKYAEDTKQMHQQGIEALRGIRSDPGALGPTASTVAARAGGRPVGALGPTGPSGAVATPPATAAPGPIGATGPDAPRAATAFPVLGREISSLAPASPSPTVRRPAQAPARPQAAPIRPDVRPAAAPKKVVRRRTTNAVSVALPVTIETPRSLAGAIAQQHVHRVRTRVLGFLWRAGLNAQIEDLQALEERLTVGTRPALQHAALSTRELFLGVADHCFIAREKPWVDARGNPRPVEQANVGNRLIAYVEGWLGTGAGSKDQEADFRAFIAIIDTLNRWNGRGPHRIRDLEEGGRFLIRALETLDLVGLAHQTATNHRLVRVSAEPS